MRSLPIPDVGEGVAGRLAQHFALRQRLTRRLNKLNEQNNSAQVLETKRDRGSRTGAAGARVLRELEKLWFIGKACPQHADHTLRLDA